jgi:hypothetical protein
MDSQESRNKMMNLLKIWIKTVGVLGDGDWKVESLKYYRNFAVKN